MAKEMDALKRRILALSAVVEERFMEAVRALERRDRALAAKVLGGDDDIDQLEVELEEECLKVLALHQPVAVDLRYIVAVLKMNGELERIGDLAVNIAEVASFLAESGESRMPEHIHLMAEKTKQMLIIDHIEHHLGLMTETAGPETRARLGEFREITKYL